MSSVSHAPARGCPSQFNRLAWSNPRRSIRRADRARGRAHRGRLRLRRRRRRDRAAADRADLAVSPPRHSGRDPRGPLFAPWPHGLRRRIAGDIARRDPRARAVRPPDLAVARAPSASSARPARSPTALPRPPWCRRLSGAKGSPRPMDGSSSPAASPSRRVRRSPAPWWAGSAAAPAFGFAAALSVYASRDPALRSQRAVRARTCRRAISAAISRKARRPPVRAPLAPAGIFFTAVFFTPSPSSIMQAIYVPYAVHRLGLSRRASDLRLPPMVRHGRGRAASMRIAAG